MLGRTYDAQNCSAARALELVGERWSLLIIASVTSSEASAWRPTSSRPGSTASSPPA
jgi:DNA-binding HxlR family transcriptional regulator